MDLILWRHADAQDGEPDMARELTAKGRRQADQMAAWLNDRLPDDTRILVSPARRTLQTAQALKREFETLSSLAPDADVVDLLAAAGWPEAQGTVLLVGHQPTLGRLAAFLLWGEEKDLSLKKAGVLWLTNRTRRDERQVVLRAAMTADLA